MRLVDIMGCQCDEFIFWGWYWHRLSCSSRYGAGLGSGYGDTGNSTVGVITISNSTVKASSLMGGAGLGSGDGSNDGWNRPGKSVVDLVMISNSTVNASSSDASGIGTGAFFLGGISTVGRIRQSDVNRPMQDGPVDIGSHGNTAQVGLLAQPSACFLNCDSKMADFPINASSIIFSNPSVVIETQQN
jgi:hypothetical protein